MTAGKFLPALKEVALFAPKQDPTSRFVPNRSASMLCVDAATVFALVELPNLTKVATDSQSK